MELESNIPKHIWEKDCRYCVFRQSEENTKKSYRDRPCALDEYNHSYKVCVDNKWINNTTYNKDKCHSFKPVDHFGLCRNCKYFNSFADEETYCTHKDGPLNRRNVYPDIPPDGPSECWKYTRCTCDRYKVEEDMKRTLLQQAIKGRIPKNFNPETWEATEYIDGKSIEWGIAVSDYEYEQRVKEREARIKEDEKIKVRKKDCDGQMNLMEFIGG